MSLFDDFDQRDPGPAFYAESKFRYLNRSGRPAAQRIRELLDNWFSRYPERHHADLRGRFRSDTDTQHQAAFFELFVHELLLRMGATVEVHPAVPDRARRPDFLVASAGGNRSYVEAVVAADESREEAAARARMNVVYDVLNRLDSPNFFVGIKLRTQPETPPPGREICRFLAEKLADLDPDALEVQFAKSGFEALPHWLHEAEGWGIEFFPLPKSAPIRGQPGIRPIGLHFEGFRWLDARRSIRDAIVEKAGAYGALDLPYLIAVNALADHVDTTDVMEALFGREQFTFRRDLGAAQRPEFSRVPDGAWTSAKGPRYTRVSAALVCTGLGPSTLRWGSACLYENPWAARKYEGELNQLPRAIARDENTMEWLNGTSLSDVFDLPPDWPGR
jgi:hypothetical protein